MIFRMQSISYFTILLSDLSRYCFDLFPCLFELPDQFEQIRILLGIDL